MTLDNAQIETRKKARKNAIEMMQVASNHFFDDSKPKQFKEFIQFIIDLFDSSPEWFTKFIPKEKFSETQILVMVGKRLGVRRAQLLKCLHGEHFTIETIKTIVKNQPVLKKAIFSYCSNQTNQKAEISGEDAITHI